MHFFKSELDDLLLRFLDSESRKLKRMEVMKRAGVKKKAVLKKIVKSQNQILQKIVKL